MLFTELERCVQVGPELPEEATPLYAALASLLPRGGYERRTGVDLDDFDDRRVFRSVDGQGLSIAACQKAVDKGKLFIDTEPSPISDALMESGGVVVHARRDDPPCRALQVMAGGIVQNARETWCLPVLVESKKNDGAWHLAESMGGHVRSLGANIHRIKRARFGAPGSPLAKRLVVAQEKAGELSPISDLEEIWFNPEEPRRDLCLNADHPTVAKLEQLAVREPEVAGYLAVTLMFEGSDLLSVDRSGLAERSWSQRCRRLKS
jgi:hypothetical protein